MGRRYPTFIISNWNQSRLCLIREVTMTPDYQNSDITDGIQYTDVTSNGYVEVSIADYSVEMNYQTPKEWAIEQIKQQPFFNQH